MNDTQWPRFEVFQQRRPGGRYHNVGSVHAPDAEIALQNARDVFVRRPQTVQLWVVPVERILARTQEELEREPVSPQSEISAETPLKTFHVFQKTSQRRSMSYVSQTGAVQAATPTDALSRARAQYGEDMVYVWWIVPAEAVVSSDEGDAASMFQPAHEKVYRLPGAYHTRTLMREAIEEDE